MSKYSAELKIVACEDYLSGKFSNREICEKYGIHFNEKRDASELNKWIQMVSDELPTVPILHNHMR